MNKINFKYLQTFLMYNCIKYYDLIISEYTFSKKMATDT